jgi:hypothetical protein
MRLMRSPNMLHRAVGLIGSVVLGMLMTGAAVMGFIVLAAQATRP